MAEHPDKKGERIIAVVNGGADEAAIDEAAKAAGLSAEEKDVLRILAGCSDRDSKVLVERMPRRSRY